MSKSKIEIDITKVSDQFEKSRNRAEAIVKDKEKTKKVLDEAMSKANSIQGPLEKVWSNLKLMFGLVSSWISGDYKEVPVGSIVMIVASLIYFLSPIDLIPDVLPVVGYIDDVFVIGLVIAQVSADLEKFKIWQEANNQA